MFNDFHKNVSTSVLMISFCFFLKRIILSSQCQCIYQSVTINKQTSSVSVLVIDILRSVLNYQFCFTVQSANILLAYTCAGNKSCSLHIPCRELTHSLSHSLPLRRRNSRATTTEPECTNSCVLKKWRAMNRFVTFTAFKDFDELKVSQYIKKKTMKRSIKGYFITSCLKNYM